MSFARALAFLLRPEIEGGYSNRPLKDDPGGETLWGISRRYNPDLPWPPTHEQVVKRYRDRYWDAIQGDRLPWPVSLAAFDAAVQHAPRDAILLLQLSLRVVADGVLGPQTRAALQAQGALEVAEELIARRAVYYPTLDNWKANALGWSRRLVALHRACLTP